MSDEFERLHAEADAMEAQAREKRRQASELRKAALLATPLRDRLVYAASARCPCGAGLAYDPAGESGRPHGYWECSAILLGTADKAVKHEAQLPFAFYEIKSERQPSAHGATTRPAATTAP